MSEPILLPGTIPGLLRRGSPVVGIHTGAIGVVAAVSEGGVSSWSSERRDPGVEVASPGSRSYSTAALTAVGLDLTDITGRLHAALWLAERLGVDCDAGAPVWAYIGEGRWHLRGASTLGVYFGPNNVDGDSPAHRSRGVPALAELPRKNPDPARALAACVLALAAPVRP
jgi:hypothetical protein